MAAREKCPHCLTAVFAQRREEDLDYDTDYGWSAVHYKCPACDRLVIYLNGSPRLSGHVRKALLVWPKGTQRPPCPEEVAKEYRDDYNEACLVIADSPKASAALTRRCLQHLLRNTLGVKPGNLAEEIQEVLDSNILPSDIAEAVDAVRNIGNFAAHPIKSTASGEILPVEPGEAD